jgi:histone-lysine N-methyltransferase SETD2
LVRGDYKSGRVKDPTAKLSSRHEKTVKNYVKEFMDKAVKKKEERDRQKVARKAEGSEGSPAAPKANGEIEEVEWDDDMLDIQKDIAASHDASPADSSSELKRKREGDEDPGSPKKFRTSTNELTAAPPPPPPPPVDDAVDVDREYESPNTTEAPGINGKFASQQNGHTSPTQLATPSTNGSTQLEGSMEYDHGSNRS